MAVFCTARIAGCILERCFESKRPQRIHGHAATSATPKARALYKARGHVATRPRGRVVAGCGRVAASL
jgi:hypothetical protein